MKLVGQPASASCRILNNPRMDREASRILGQLGVEVKSLHDKGPSILSGELRQMIAIARVLTFPARLIIIDEPTVLLSYPNQQRLFGLIQNWRQQGVAVLFSSNNLDHLFAVTDRIIILHQGRKVADLRTDETTREAVVSLLLGSADPQKSASRPSGILTATGASGNRPKSCAITRCCWKKTWPPNRRSTARLTEQLAEQVQALDQINLALLEAQRRLIIGTRTGAQTRGARAARPDDPGFAEYQL